MNTNDRDKLYPWLAVLRAKYMGSGRARALVEHFGSLQAALRADAGEIAALKGFSAEIAASIREAAQGKFDAAVDKELRWAEKQGVRIVLYSDSDFPEPLRNIPAPPAILYVKGAILPQDVISLGIVGTRRATDAGKRAANRIACELAEAGLTINSGLAWGVDASAHKGALKCKSGRTLAVMGNGLKFIYPKEYVALAEQVVQRGALITELFHDVAPDSRNFPPRNRIISGLSLGVLIVEAPERSGALITARYALEQGREIYALPGAIDAPNSEGVNQLIHDSAALLVTSAQQILDELEDKIAFYREALEGKIPRVGELPSPPRREPSKKDHDSSPVLWEADIQTANSTDVTTELPANLPKPAPIAPRTPEAASMTEDERFVFERLGETSKHIDVLCRELEWPMAKVSSVIGLLELKGLIEREAGMRFRREG